MRQIPLGAKGSVSLLVQPEHQVDGRQIEFAVRATEATRKLGVGSYSRVVIDVAKFVRRLG
jgi:predicted thioesterase